jgi:hypothetical protein
MAAFQVCLQSEKKRNIRWVGATVMLFLVKKFPGEKGSMKWRVIMMQQPDIVMPKFEVKYSHTFMHLP